MANVRLRKQKRSIRTTAVHPLELPKAVRARKKTQVWGSDGHATNSFSGQVTNSLDIMKGAFIGELIREIIQSELPYLSSLLPPLLLALTGLSDSSAAISEPI